MDLKLYNHLTRRKEIFKPIKKKTVGLYTCGPTVYDYAHIGNLRTYIFEDVLRRTLEYNDYGVKHIMNITDVEDKIIKKMRVQKKTLKQITVPYTKFFFKDLKSLNILRASSYPKATEHIPQMINIISSLLKRRVAYKSDDGSIYFDISKFKKYGRLSGVKTRNAKSRISADEYDKQDIADFVLWKTGKANEPSWPAPFGKGRPGWHIECSAMSMKYLGKTFDIHAGAIDLLFPHHENEIAQSESATGKKFVNYWIEGEHLLVDSKKMSKSLGNMYFLQDIIKKDFNPLAFRYLVLGAHYRSKLNFTWQSLESAENTLEKLYSTFTDLKGARDKRTLAKEKPYIKVFQSAINDDLNTPKALRIVWKVIKDTKLSNASKKSLLLQFDEVLGLNLNKIKIEKAPKNILELVKKREELRDIKDFKKADAIRKKILQHGWIIEDTPQGPKVKTRSN